MNISQKISALFLFLATLSSSVSGQGSLTPPGAPAPTMQTLGQLGAKADQANTKLDQVNAKADTLDARSEKRIPVGDATTPGNDSYHFIITQPGSYYLTGNLSVTKAHGIQVNAEAVTLDLNGFEISRAGGNGNGIEISATSHRATIRNGSVKGSFFGINSIIAADAQARACAFRDLSVTNCAAGGDRSRRWCGVRILPGA